MNNPQLKYGIEIEGAFNKGLITTHKRFLINPKSKLSSKWMEKSDGSLRADETYFNRVALREFVTREPYTKKGMFRQLKIFKDCFGKNELNACVVFNKSAGLHIHFSLKDFNFYDKTLYSTLIKLREKTLNDISLSDIENKHLIIEQYKRRYATQIKKIENTHYMNIETKERISLKLSGTRYHEFNFNSEKQKRGFEWRAPNVRGVKTWRDFFKAIEIYINCIEWFREQLNKQQEQTRFYVSCETTALNNNKDIIKVEKQKDKIIIIEKSNENIFTIKGETKDNYAYYLTRNNNTLLFNCRECETQIHKFDAIKVNVYDTRAIKSVVCRSCFHEHYCVNCKCLFDECECDENDENDGENY